MSRGLGDVYKRQHTHTHTHTITTQLPLFTTTRQYAITDQGLRPFDRRKTSGQSSVKRAASTMWLLHASRESNPWRTATNDCKASLCGLDFGQHHHLSTQLLFILYRKHAKSGNTGRAFSRCCPPDQPRWLRRVTHIRTSHP